MRGLGVVGEAALERGRGEATSRLRALFAAFCVGAAAGTLTYRVLRSGNRGSDERDEPGADA